MPRFMCAVLALCVSGAIAAWQTAASAQTVNVTLGPGLTDKFPCLTKVLTNVRVTFDRPVLWGKVWDAPVPKTGLTALTNYRLSQMAPDFVRYLTNGKLGFDLVVAKKTTPAAETVSTTLIHLHQSAGLWMPSNTYSDYGLAVTIAHELVRVWQFDHQMFPTLYPSKNDAPYYIAEDHLPKELFDDTRVPDPGGTTPLPPCVEAQRPTLATITLDVEGAGRGSVSLVLPEVTRFLGPKDHSSTGPVNSDGIFDASKNPAWNAKAREAVNFDVNKLPPIQVTATLTLNQPLGPGWSAGLFKSSAQSGDPPLCSIKRTESSCSATTTVKPYGSFEALINRAVPLAPLTLSIGIR